jgi:rhodanese-related sulfurtransferase
MSAYSNIDAGGLQELQAGKHMLIDVRTDKEVERGLIPGALHIPLHTLPSRLAEIAHDCPVVIYCQSGVRSAHAGAFLAQNGWDNIHNLVGGFGAWAAQGLPVTQN